MPNPSTTLDQALAHHQAGRFAAAVTLYEQLLKHKPDDPETLARLADAQQSLGKLNLAAQAYQQAVTLDPKHHRAWFGLACLYNRLGHHAPAAQCFAESLAAAPDQPHALHNLGQALLKLGQVDEALEQFRKATALTDDPLPRSAIAIAIPGSPAADHSAVLHARQDWARHATADTRPIYPPVNQSTKNSVADSTRLTADTPPSRAPTRPLRVGYVSSFFHKRNWMKPVWALLNQHDRDQIEIHVFSDAPLPDVGPGYHRHPRDHYHDTTDLDNAKLAALIHQHHIDVLVDLNGYSDLRRLPLLAHRPTRVVIAWFNMYATTGMPCVDYLIGDDHVIRPHEEPHYTETILRVPGSYLTFRVDYPVPDVAPPPSASAGHFTFGCLASQYKITPQVATAWAEILHAAPNSRLLIKNAALKSPANQQYMRDLFQRLGIPPERLTLQGPSEHHEFLKTYNAIDLALDPFPYNGGTTTTEALWQGVPVLTFDGDRWASRTSASILRTAGLGQFVADDLPGYVALAVNLAKSTAAARPLAELRMSLRDRLAASPVCDAAALARNMETIYQHVTGPNDRHAPQPGPHGA